MIIIGHRGASGYAPENTLTSFQKALNLGIKKIECDVRVCKTGEVVVIHDKKINRTTDSKGYVAKKTLSELKNCKIKNKETIPTLEEVLDLIDNRVVVNIELKAKGLADKISKIIDKYIIKYSWSSNNFIVSSFNKGELKKFQKLNKNIKIGILKKRLSWLLVKWAVKLNVYFIGIKNKKINPKKIEEIHKKGIKIFVYVINNREEFKKNKDLKIDGVFSDYPGGWTNL